MSDPSKSHPRLLPPALQHWDVGSSLNRLKGAAEHAGSRLNHAGGSFHMQDITAGLRLAEKELKQANKKVREATERTAGQLHKALESGRHMFHTTSGDSTDDSGPGLDTQDLVAQWAILSFVRDEIDEADACLSLPMAMLLFVAYAVMALLRLNHEDAFGLEHGLEHDIQENANFAWSHNMGHKGIDDVNSVADFFSWTRLGLVPLVIGPAQTYTWSEEFLQGNHPAPGTCTTRGAWQPYEDAGAELKTRDSDPTNDVVEFPYQPSTQVPVRGDFLRYNRLIGGLQFVQTVAEESRCKMAEPHEEMFSKWWRKKCYAAPSHFNLPPEDWAAERVEHMHRTEWFLVEQSLDSLSTKLVDMETGCQGTENRTCLCEPCQAAGNYAEGVPGFPWIDERTEKVSIRFLIFNPTYGQYALTSVVFFFARSGHIWKRIVVQSFQKDPYGQSVLGNIVVIAAFAIWCLILLRNFCVEASEVIRTVRRYGVGAIRTEYLDFWNVVDWVSILGSIPVLTSWFMFDNSVYKVNDTAMAMIEQGQMYDVNELNNLYSLVDDVNWNAKLQRYWFCMYPLIVMLRLFKSFHAQPRLALVTRTLVQCSVDVAHFGLVLSVISITYCVGGICLFGQDLDNYANFPRSLHSTFRMILGDTNWDDLAMVGEVPAGAYYWTFNVLLATIMLNMLLAIIMDTYSKVKDSIGDNAETLISQGKEIMNRYRLVKAGNLVRMSKVYEVFCQLATDKLQEENIADYTGADGTVDWQQMQEDGKQQAETSTELLTFENILKAVKGITPEQVKELMNGGKVEFEKTNPANSDERAALDDITHDLNTLTAALKELEAHVQYIDMDQLDPNFLSEIGAPPGADLLPSLEDLATMYKEGLVTRQEFDACKPLVLAHLGIDIVHV